MINELFRVVGVTILSIWCTSFGCQSQIPNIEGTQTGNDYVVGLGTDYNPNISSRVIINSGGQAVYSLPNKIPADTIAVSGVWHMKSQSSLPAWGGSLTRNFNAKHVYLDAMSTKDPVRVQVLVDGNIVATNAAGSDIKRGFVEINERRDYDLVDLETSGPHVFRMEVLGPDLEAFSLKFTQ